MGTPKFYNKETTLKLSWGGGQQGMVKDHRFFLPFPYPTKWCLPTTQFFIQYTIQVLFYLLLQKHIKNN